MVEQLRARLPPGIAVAGIERSTGGSSGLCSDFDVLVGGYPRPEDLAGPSLNAVVVPYSGLAPESRALLLDYPRVAVHRLDYNSVPTAEMAIALLLAAQKNIVAADRGLREGDWLTNLPLRLVADSVALVLGYGAVGSRVAALCTALGMRVVAVRRRHAAQEALGHDMHGPDDLHALLPLADAVLVCLPLTPKTEGLLGREELALLRSTAVVVNVGRAPVVDEAALYDALASGALFAAAMDVWYVEPTRLTRPADHRPSRYPFHRLQNVVMSPHRAFRGAAAESRRVDALVSSLLAAARGEPMPNRIDVRAGY
jgi:phosphoglycerate dehydrogenase-like enzyme